MAEQRYDAVLAVIRDGHTVTDVATATGVSRQTLHTGLARHEVDSLDGLADRSHRPHSCPRQMPAEVEALVLEARRSLGLGGVLAGVHRSWWPRRRRSRCRGDLVSRPASPRCIALCCGPDWSSPTSSDVGVVVGSGGSVAVRWNCGRWTSSVGSLLADGTRAKALTGVDDCSRFCVSARLMPRERTRPVCAGLLEALRLHGVPEQILTDNGQVFTGRFFSPPGEVLFDRICRENGVQHLRDTRRAQAE